MPVVPTVISFKARMAEDRDGDGRTTREIVHQSGSGANMSRRGDYSLSHYLTRSIARPYMKE